LFSAGQILAPWAGAALLRRLTARPTDLLERTDGALKLLALIYLMAVPSALATLAGSVLAHGVPPDRWLEIGSTAWLG
ncbi:hypothetical protein NK918_25135, partial [Salmonella enterica subsp. enterica serovar Typhimurium]|nr:hypothetical protein [Salmonella enterica subsp. enterica serovar Typhimurium]